MTSRTGNIDDEFEWVLRYDVAGDTWDPAVEYGPRELDQALVSGVHAVGDDLFIFGREFDGVTAAL